MALEGERRQKQEMAFAASPHKARAKQNNPAKMEYASTSIAKAMAMRRVLLAKVPVATAAKTNSGNMSAW